MPGLWHSSLYVSAASSPPAPVAACLSFRGCTALRDDCHHGLPAALRAYSMFRIVKSDGAALYIAVNVIYRHIVRMFFDIQRAWDRRWADWSVISPLFHLNQFCLVVRISGCVSFAK